MDPAQSSGGTGLPPKLHVRHVLEVLSGLVAVARPAGRHAILPRGATALAAGDDVIDVVGVFPAILTQSVVTHENGLAVQRGPALSHLDVAAQRHHRRYLH
jgi:hypothetical protein